MAFQFPDKPYDGQTVEVLQPNGSEFIYTYNQAQNTWELAGQGVDLDQNNIVIFTDNVLARGSRPPANVRNTNYKNNRNDSTFEAINNQQDINWVLHDAINLVEGATKVWVDNTEPSDETYQFWWHTDTLELLFKYNNQWWPVSIPPDQVEILRQEIDALYQDTATNKLNIAITQQELDTKVLETKERIDEVEGIVNDTAENAAFVNQDNTFASNRTNTFKGNLESEKQLTIAAPSNTNYNPTFQIKGTARTGTVNSVVLRATQSNSRMRVTYRGPIDEDDELTTRKYVEDRLGGNKPDGPKAWKYVSVENWDSATASTGTFTIDKDNAKIYLNCHDEDGRWWCYRRRDETYSDPQPHFTIYAASGTMVWDSSIKDAHFYESTGDNKRITTLEYSAGSSYYWNTYMKEGHYFVIHFLSYLPNFRERHLEKLNPTDSTFSLPNDPDGLQLDEIEVEL